MAQSVVLINNKDQIPPNLCLVCLCIICYSRIYKVLDLFIVGDLVVVSQIASEDNLEDPFTKGLARRSLINM